MIEWTNSCRAATTGPPHMPDFYTEVDRASAEQIDLVRQGLEARAATPQQQAALENYLDRVNFPDGARVADIGCGTGEQARVVARWPGVGAVDGVDMIAAFLDRARELAAGYDNLAFHLGRAEAVPLPDAAYDVVIMHTLLNHVPEPAAALAEAWRLLRPGGTLAIYDGDFSTATLASAPHDPLQACAETFVEFQVHDPLIVRHLPALVQAAGFDVGQLRSHPHVETDRPAMMARWIERTTGLMVAAGRIGEPLAAALRDEVARRVAAGTFYGAMNFASLIARKPA